MTEIANNLDSDSRGNTAGPLLIRFFANNPVAANLLMLLMLFGGFIAARGLTAQIFPTIDPGMITVSVVYPGATPSEVEESITRRVDEAVRGIDGIDRVISKASEGYGRVTIELKDFVNGDKVRDDVESAVDRIADFPPLDAEEPEVVRNESLQPVMSLAITSNGDEFHLDRGVSQIEEALLSIPSVSHVAVEGAREYEISIEVSEETLQRYNLTLDEISQTIRFSSLNLSSGELRTEAGDLLLRTDQKRETAAEFESIVLRTLPGGTVLRLGDVAKVTDGFSDDELANELDGERSVFLRVRKSPAEDALEIARDIKNLFENYETPAGISIKVWEDETEILASRLSLLLRNGALGFTLVFLFLVVMLDLRLAFWVAMGVPISFLGAFLFFDFFDVNINMVSLFALIIVLGIVVDDAIVIGENIGSEQQKGLVGSAASVAGVRGVFSPVFVGVVTTMAAFAPLLFVTGTFGQILGVVPVVVITVLAMSLVEVFFILPAHLSHEQRWSRRPLDQIQTFIAARVQTFRDNVLTPFIRSAVKHRYMTLAYGLGFLTLALVLVINQAVRIEFFPYIESDRIVVNIDFPVGTPFEVTDAATRYIRDAINQVNLDLGGTSIKSVSMTSGGRTLEGRGPGASAGMTFARNIASVTIQLNEEPLRTISTPEIERLVRQQVGVVPGAEAVNYASDLMSESSVIEYELTHTNEDRLRQAVETMHDELAKMPMMTEIQDTLSDGKRQFDIELTPEGEAANLTPALVARQLRQNFFGEEVQRIQRGRDEIKVMVRYPKEERRSSNDFFNTRIRLPDGTELPFNTVARVSESRSRSAIDRIDGLRVVQIRAEVDKQYMSTGEATRIIESDLMPELKSAFPLLTVNEAGFGREQSEDLSSLSKLAAIALLVIFTLIAALLRSYSMPLVILSGIPFGVAGAVVGHFILGYDLSMISMFGMVALSGVVVNDSLVLVDRFRKLRVENPHLTIQEAVIEATRLRFRAIFLTTATTALGLTPMLFEKSLQAQFLIPMAISLATGIVFASFVIIFLVPSLVVVRDDILGVFRRLSGNVATTDENLKTPQSI